MIDFRHVFFEGESGTTSTRAESTPSAGRDSGAAACRKPRARDADAAEAFSPLIRVILLHCGLTPEWYQPKALNRRVPACLRQLRVHSETGAVEKVTSQPELARHLLSSVLIGVTSFFRDQAVFDHLWKVSLPRMLHGNRRLFICSIGCSSGHELYSLAMMLDDLGALANSRLVGVDCRPDALQQAKSGEFNLAEMQDLDPRLRERYFELDGTRARISSDLRAKIDWRIGSLANAKPGDSWSIVLFRNVAIYLRPEKANAVWQDLDEQLSPGGLLVTGRAERPPRRLNYTQEHASIYAKQEL